MENIKATAYKNVHQEIATNMRRLKIKQRKSTGVPVKVLQELSNGKDTFRVVKLSDRTIGCHRLRPEGWGGGGFILSDVENRLSELSPDARNFYKTVLPFQMVSE